MQPTSTVAPRLTRTLPGRFYHDPAIWELPAGARSRAFAAGGFYVPIEAHIRGFDDFVLERLGLTATDPDAGPA